MIRFSFVWFLCDAIVHVTASTLLWFLHCFFSPCFFLSTLTRMNSPRLFPAPLIIIIIYRTRKRLSALGKKAPFFLCCSPFILAPMAHSSRWVSVEDIRKRCHCFFFILTYDVRVFRFFFCCIAYVSFFPPLLPNSLCFIVVRISALSVF